MRRVTTSIHGLFDYTGAVAMVIAPQLFGFSTVGGAAVWSFWGLAAVILVQAVCTDYEAGVLRLVPMKLHLGIDLLLATGLALSPWLCAFYDPDSVFWLTHVLVGLSGLLLASNTQRVPRYIQQQKVRPLHANATGLTASK